MKRIYASILMLSLVLTLLTSCNAAKEVDTSAAVDIDLSTMSATMVYSYVYDMTRDSAPFEGKIIRAQGKMYNTDPDEITGKVYHYVVISDATACCQQGLEFIWDDNKRDYPEKDSEVLVSGVFSHYMEDDMTYYYINADSLTVVQPSAE